MAPLPPIGCVDPTLTAADRALEQRAAAELPRPYLGASGAGEACARRVWLGFRWAARDARQVAGIKAIEDGHHGELVQAARLRLVEGVQLWTEDPATGQQIRVVFSGHVMGSVDGVIKGLLQAPRTPHVWEHKQRDEKYVTALENLKVTKGEKHALEAWSRVYFVQAQLYMLGLGLTRHYLTCASPGGRRTVSVRTDFQREVAEGERDRAIALSLAAHAPAKLEPDDWSCKWCPFAGLCHGNTLPVRSCRTCVHSTPTPEGGWRCERYARALTVDEQRVGCADQRYLPDLVPGEQVDVAPDGAWIEYVMPGGGRWIDEGASAPATGPTEREE